MQTAAGLPCAWVKPFGKGRVIALTAFPKAYTQSPHAEAGNLELVRKLAALGGAEARGELADDGGPDSRAASPVRGRR